MVRFNEKGEVEFTKEELDTMKAICAPYDALAKKYNNTTIGIYDDKRHCIGQLEEGDDGFVELLLDSNMAYHKVWHYPSRLPDGKTVTSYFKDMRRGEYPFYNAPKYKGDSQWANFPEEIIRLEYSDLIKKYDTNYDEAMKAFDKRRKLENPEHKPQVLETKHVMTILYDDNRNEIGQLSEDEHMFLQIQIKGKKALYVIEYPSRDGCKVSIKRLKPEQFIIHQSKEKNNKNGIKKMNSSNNKKIQNGWKPI